MTEKRTGGKYKKNWNTSQHYKDVRVAEQYDRSRFAGLSGRVFDRREKMALERSLSDLQPDSLISDAPSGTGRLAETLLEMGHRVVGADISPEMLHVLDTVLVTTSEDDDSYGTSFSRRC